MSGSGRIASDVTSKWFEAQLTLDTLNVALFQPDSLDIPLRGVVSGTMTLSAIGDTMSVDAQLRSGDGSIHLTGTALLDSMRTQMDMRGTLQGLDPGRFLRRRDIPALSLSGSARVAVNDDRRAVDRHIDLHLDSLSRIGDSPITTATLRFGQDSSGIHVDTLIVRTGAKWSVDARGQLAAHGHSTTDSITFSTVFDSLGALNSLLLDSTGAPRFKSLEGRIRTDSGVVRGTFEHASLSTNIGLTDVGDGTTRVRSGVGQLVIRNLPDSATGTFRGSITGLESGQWRIDTGTVTASIEGGSRARVAGRFAKGDSTEITLGAEVTWSDSSYRVQVDSMDAHILDHRWHLALPATLRITKSSLSVDSLKMESDHLATVVAAGTIPQSGAMNATLEVRSLGLSELALLGVVPEALTGRISASARFGGTRDAPTISATATVDSIQSEERDARRDSVSIELEGSYASKKASISLSGLSRGRKVLDARGDIPLDLTLRTVADRIIDAPMLLKVRADSLGLGLFDGLVPRISGLGGYLTTDLEIGGTLRRPRGSGSLALYEGAFEHRRFGLSAEDGIAVVKLAGDSVIIERLRLSDGDSPGDTVSVRGVVLLTGRRWTEWTVDLQSTANKFRVIDDPRVATAEADWELDVDGKLAVPHVRGVVRLPRAVFTIGPQRRPRNTAVADSLVEVSVATPNLDGVLVSLGSDVRLKSRDANVQLEGDLELFGPVTMPWISGVVTATRGTYRVNVGGVISRTFRVDSGTVLLEGTPNVPPTLDIYTQYVVRRPDEDVVIRAHLYGTTYRPRLDLSSELGTAVSQSEIISYLVFGQPSFALQEGGVKANISTAAAPILPTVGAWLEGALSSVMPFFNTLQVTSTVSADAPGNLITNPFETTLNSYALTGGRQIGTDTFFSLSAGRCGASSTSSTGSVPLWGGAVVDYRPKRSIGASFSIDPGPAPCSRISTIGDNSYQLGLDLSYDWRFGRKPPR